ncbi:MAG: hypothetical protein V2I33_13610 [Kangiellaceae bacterium]|jgi:hypothetical protein|nr:hypothetical protein [Kangiellaceae bacterium]
MAHLISAAKINLSLLVHPTDSFIALLYTDSQINQPVSIITLSIKEWHATCYIAGKLFCLNF